MASRLMEGKGWSADRADHFASVVTAVQSGPFDLDAVRNGMSAGHNAHVAARALNAEVVVATERLGAGSWAGEGAIGGDRVLQVRGVQGK